MVFRQQVQLTRPAGGLVATIEKRHKNVRLFPEVFGMATNWENSAAELSSWYQSLREGGSRATEQLWRMYFERMVLVARRKIGDSRRVAADEEDVALSAFKSFCMGFQQGKFKPDGAVENLWPLLVTLTLNKAIDHVRRERRLKRGGGGVPECDRGQGAERQGSGRVDFQADWTELVSLEPTPEMQLAAEESFEQLLSSLDATGDSSLRDVLLLSMTGYSTHEVAAHLECTVRTIQRKLQTIRALWEQTNA
jgi:RNA polymerase sigma factor (sigma-70 family)